MHVDFGLKLANEKNQYIYPPPHLQSSESSKFLHSNTIASSPYVSACVSLSFNKIRI